MHKFTKSLCSSRSSYFWNHSSELDTLVNQYSHATPIRSPVGKRSLLSPTPPRSFHLYALAPFFARPECEKLLRAPEFRSRCSGTLATQARTFPSRSDVTDSFILESFFSPALETNWLTHQLTHEKCNGLTIHKILTTVITLKLNALVVN